MINLILALVVGDWDVAERMKADLGINSKKSPDVVTVSISEINRLVDSKTIIDVMSRRKQSTSH